MRVRRDCASSAESLSWLCYNRAHRRHVDDQLKYVWPAIVTGDVEVIAASFCQFGRFVPMDCGRRHPCVGGLEKEEDKKEDGPSWLSQYLMRWSQKSGS